MDLAYGSYQVQDEESLVHRAKKGEEQAFARLYEAHFDRIYRYVALKIGDRIEAEDMAQQVFVNAYKSLPNFRWQKTPVSAWFFRIAHNLVVDYLRRKTKQPSVPLDESLASGGDDPAEMAEYSLDVEKLSLALKKLTEAQREVISLRFAGGLPIAEVAKIMGKTQGAIKALQHSAIIALRKVMVVENDETVQTVG